MAYVVHPDFKTPDNLDSRIWRYLDFTKFLSMLENQALYFCRLDVLAETDPYEGLYTNLNARAQELEYEEVPKEVWERGGIKSEEDWENNRLAHQQIRSFIRVQREFTFVNAWCVNDYESAAMWPLYVQGNEGIAVQSTFQRLVDSVAAYKEFEIHIGEVRYLDYNAEVIELGQALLPLIAKRKSFEHEQELRALIWTLQDGKNNFQENKYAATRGLTVPVDLGTLIEQIFVSPQAPNWYVELAVAVLARYGLNKPVIQSDISSNPLY